MVLKTDVRETVPGVRIPLPPPYSLDCREFPPLFPPRLANYARFSRSLPKKADCRERTATVWGLHSSVFFSAAAVSSPTCSESRSEQLAITNRMHCESGLDFDALSITADGRSLIHSQSLGRSLLYAARSGQAVCLFVSKRERVRRVGQINARVTAVQLEHGVLTEISRQYSPNIRSHSRSSIAFLKAERMQRTLNRCASRGTAPPRS